MAVVGFWRGSPRVLGAEFVCGDFAGGVEIGTVTANGVQEASGMAASQRNPGVLWLHNDGSNRRVYAVLTNGVMLGAFTFDDEVEDLEDIAVGPGPSIGVSYLYVGDIGGSAGTNTVRESVRILRIPEPVVSREEGQPASDLEGVAVFNLKYPDGSYDSETVLVDPISHDVFILTKQGNGSRVYRANLDVLAANSTNMLEFAGVIDFEDVSGGDISPDGAQIILRNEDAARLWTRAADQSVIQALSGEAITVPVIGTPEEPNGEAITYLRDGTGYVTISEGSDPEVYFFQATCLSAPRIIMGLEDAVDHAGGTHTFEVYAAGYPAPSFKWSFNGTVVFGETNSFLRLEFLTEEMEGEYQVVVSNSTGVATSSASLMVEPVLNLVITEVMPLSATNGSVATGDWWELTSFTDVMVDLSDWRFNDSNGGLESSAVIPDGTIIAPGESVIFVQNLSAEEFRAWWGSSNLPADVQIISYSGPGLGLGAGGDEIWIWDDAGVEFSFVSFGVSDAGVSLNYDVVTQQFGGQSELGMNGVIRAASGTDIGSPGKIGGLPQAPILSASISGGMLRIEFTGEAGRTYFLEERVNYGDGDWQATGEEVTLEAGGIVVFLRPIQDERYFRVRVE